MRCRFSKEACFMKEVDDEDDLAAIIAGASQRVVALFYASWCPFCREFLPVFEKYVQKFSEQSLRVRIDDEMNPLWEKYEVTVVPTVIVFGDGKVQRRLDGVLGLGLSEEQFKHFLERL
jgi:thioredoxin 1